MAFLSYQDINFVVPEYLSEYEFYNLKKKGINNQSILPNFLRFQLSNAIVTIICVLAVVIDKIFPAYYTEIFSTLGIVILIFWIPKIFIETYKFIKFKYNERTFYRKLNALLDITSYPQFRLEYDKEFIKSKFGSWLIKTFKKQVMENLQGQVLILHDTALNLLKTKVKTKDEVVDWLVEQGVSEEKSKIVVRKLQEQILRHKKSDRLRTIISGLSICGIGILLTIFQTGFIWWAAIIFGGLYFLMGLSMEVE